MRSTRSRTRGKSKSNMNATSYQTNYTHVIELFKRIAGGMNIAELGDGNKNDSIGVLADMVANDGDIDVNRSYKDMTGADFANLMSMTKRSQTSHYELLHYDMIAAYNNSTLKQYDKHDDADMTDSFTMWNVYGGLLCEMRGMVLDLNTMQVVSNPYYKFRNMDECSAYSRENVAKAIADNGGQMIATEKMDGSLMQLHYTGDEKAFRDGLLASTSNTLADNDGRIDTNDHLHALYTQYLDKDDSFLRAAKQYPDMTFCYEMVYPPADPHVVSYDKDRWGLYLHGMRDVNTGKIMPYENLLKVSKDYGIKTVPVVAHNMAEMDVLRKTWKGHDHEGVVCNVDGWLVKVKCEDFLSLSRMAHKLSSPDTKNGFLAIEQAMDNDTLDDLVAGMPDGYKSKLNDVVKDISDFQCLMRDKVDNVIKAIPADCDNPYKWVNQNSQCPAALRSYVFQALRQYDGKTQDMKFFAWDGTSYGKQSREYLNKKDFMARYEQLKKI